VHDNEDRMHTFPLSLALRTGTPRLLMLTAAYVAVLSIAIVVVATTMNVVS